VARLFDDAVPHYISAASAVLSGVPITMACRFNSDDLTAEQVLVNIGRSDNDAHYFVLMARGGVGGDPVGCLTEDGIAFAAAATSSGYSANTWHHAAAVFDAVDSRAVFIDGGGKGTNATSVTPASLDQTAIGVQLGIGVSGGTSGRVAEVGIWDVALTDAEVAVLAAGYSPLLVRPQNLVFYAPLVREILDVVGGVSLTNTGSTVGDHPRVLLPPPPSLIMPPGAAVAAITSQRLKIGVGR
jgi:hypothetical protein